MADYNPKARRRRPAAVSGEPAAVDAVLEVVDHLPSPGRDEPPVPNEVPDPTPTVPGADTESDDVASDTTPAAGESAIPVSTTPTVAPVGNPDTAAPARKLRPVVVAAVIGVVVVAVVVILAGRRRR